MRVFCDIACGLTLSWLCDSEDLCHVYISCYSIGLWLFSDSVQNLSPTFLKYSTLLPHMWGMSEGSDHWKHIKCNIICYYWHSVLINLSPSVSGTWYSWEQHVYHEWSRTDDQGRRDACVMEGQWHQRHQNRTRVGPQIHGLWAGNRRELMHFLCQGCKYPTWEVWKNCCMFENQLKIKIKTLKIHFHYLSFKWSKKFVCIYINWKISVILK